MNILNKLTILIITIIIFKTHIYAFSNTYHTNIPIWIELPKNEQNKNKINLPSIAPLVSKAENAVLIVTTEAIIKNKQHNFYPEFEQEPFQEFFKFFNPPQQHELEHKTKGQGSGFIIHPNGFALTNHHVVEGATSIKIKVGTNLQEYDAEIIGSDANTDVALIKIKSTKNNWPVIPLGSSSKLKVGDFAVAIGNPFGLELSVSMGIVSARGRRKISPSGRKGLYDFIQIDNSINFGNSGGPLLNLKGEAVGINTAISTLGHGIAFSIPIDQVKKMLPQLKQHGKIDRSYLGVKILDVMPSLAKTLGMKIPHGALVREVIKNSPAEKSGIQAGDVITHFNNKIIKNASSLQVMSGLCGVNKTIPITIFRNKQTKSINIKLSNMPTENNKHIDIHDNINNITHIKSLGLSITAFNPKIHKQLKFNNLNNGILVTLVDHNSIAYLAGIQKHDIIININRKKITSVKTFINIVEKTPKNEILQLLLHRKETNIFIAIQKQ